MAYVSFSTSQPSLLQLQFIIYHFSFMHIMSQQELSKIADDAARKYNENTAIEDRTPKGIAEAMRAACRKQHKQLHSQFTKHVCVADPALGDDFLQHVKLHWESKEKPEMTLEKLQMVATTVVAPEFRVRWLRWWNAGPLVRAGVRFPKAPVSDNRLLEWLNKAAFYARVSVLVNHNLKDVFILCSLVSC